MTDYELWSLWIAGLTAAGGIAAGIFVGIQVMQAAEAQQREWAGSALGK